MMTRGQRAIIVLEDNERDREQEREGNTKTYGMRAIVGAAEVGHAIQTGKGASTTVVAMRVEFLLGEDIIAAL